MKSYSRSHLTDQALLQQLKEVLSRERKVVGAITAEVLSYIAEFDARELFRPAGHPSMKSFCILALGMTEDEAGRRIHAARCAHRFPEIFPALEDGRLHLTAVGLLASHLTEENSSALLAAALDKSKSEIERLIADRFPRTESLPLVESMPSSEFASDVSTATCGRQHVPEHVPPSSRPKPIAPQRYSITLTMGQEMRDDLQRAQDLLAHRIPPGHVEQVLHRGLKALIRQLERRKFAATEHTRPGRGSSEGRHLPAEVRRAVAKRDGRQCTFVSDSGHRCPARSMLEFDHIVPFARGGKSTVQNLRLRCRAHNQYEAEQVYGREFMEAKREEAQQAAARKEQIEDVVAGLRNLGVPAARARRAAEFSAAGLRASPVAHTQGPDMKSLTTALCALCLLAIAAPSASSDVNVNRSGSENPMVEVSRSTIYGGVTGLVLGGALAIATDGNDANYLKWGFVTGTFFGFAYGLYHVQSRPHALLELSDERLALRIPPPTLAPDGTLRVSLLAARF